ncbi:hypothetical protein QQP08_007127, partial [Theobroma cacao]
MLLEYGVGSAGESEPQLCPLWKWCTSGAAALEFWSRGARSIVLGAFSSFMALRRRMKYRHFISNKRQARPIHPDATCPAGPFWYPMHH